MMELVLLTLVAWVGVSFAVALVLGFAFRRADLLEGARSVEALQARAQHPASRAA